MEQGQLCANPYFAILLCQELGFSNILGQSKKMLPIEEEKVGNLMKKLSIKDKRTVLLVE